jgi:hypothetical protein
LANGRIELIDPAVFARREERPSGWRDMLIWVYYNLKVRRAIERSGDGSRRRTA